MNNTENPSTTSWEKIQGGVRETERLIGQKKYNMSMIKARQTLEYMVKCLCDRENIVESGLIDMIDALFDSGAISKTTCEHYHKIRTIGNKANHEDDNSAYNANQAHHLLSQEVYTFANDYSDKKKRPASSAAARSTEGNARRRSSSGGTGSRRRASQSSGFSIDLGSLIKPLLLVAIIFVLIFIIRMITPDKKEVNESTAPVTSELSTEASTEAVTTEPETVATIMYKTIDTINVRSGPSTDSAKVGLLGPDTPVEFVKEYDDKWCIIKYNGQDAYVAKEFVQPLTP